MAPDDRGGGSAVGVILTVNGGSSSVRLAAFRSPELAPVARHRYEIDPAAAGHGFAAQLQRLALPGAPAVVVHRVVHGGRHFAAPCLIDETTERALEALVPLAPLHQPVALALLRAVRTALGPALPQIAVFDTAFFSDLPVAARHYALPMALCEQYGIRRYGFHGLAHQAMLEAWAQHDDRARPDARVISLQLGAGCSVTASIGGRPVDTSMGFSPLEGLVMATRSGDVDPAVLLYLQREAGLSPEALETLLNRRAGLLGLSGISGDVGALLASEAPAARLALDVYCRRIRRHVGACMAVLGGVDAILFGGGVGENVALVRARALEGLGFAGIAIDPQANAGVTGSAACISTGGAPVRVWVTPVDEAHVMARAVRHLPELMS